MDKKFSLLIRHHEKGEDAGYLHLLIWGTWFFPLLSVCKKSDIGLSSFPNDKF